MVAGTLEEYGGVEAKIIDAEAQTIGKAGQTVADNLAVAGIVDSVGAYAYDAVRFVGNDVAVFIVGDFSAYVDVFEVAGFLDSVGNFAHHV